jgi:hypothetical protein
MRFSRHHKSLESSGTAGKPRAAKHRPAAGLFLALRGIVALHGDEGGTISIVSVFTLLLLAMILGMVINVGRQVDGKIKMQNAADAATYSGGLVLVRGMNTLVFTNRLLCDVFAVTAYLREAEQQNAASLVPPILAAWKNIGPALSQSQFPQLAALGPAIQQQVPMQQQMVQAYSDWCKATADVLLPTWEQILQQELIPKFQRALVTATPQLSQLAANQIATLQGQGSPERGNMQATMWRTSGNAIGGNGETSPLTRTLPVVDPELDNLANQAQYQATAIQQRQNTAQNYLNTWNNQLMAAFRQIGQMSQFSTLWSGFTCGQLNKLLNQDYPNTNLPFQIRQDLGQMIGNPAQILESDYKFIGVCYWPPLVETMPGLFTNPTSPAGRAAAAAEQTFAAVSMYIPDKRLVWQYNNPVGGGGNNAIPIGGVPGDSVNLPGTGNNNNNGGNNNNGAGTWFVGRQGNSTAWNLFNQNWTLKLVPAVSTNNTNMVTILQTPPPMFAAGGQAPQVPSLGNLSIQDWNLLNSH